MGIIISSFSFRALFGFVFKIKVHKRDQWEKNIRTLRYFSCLTADQLLLERIVSLSFVKISTTITKSRFYFGCYTAHSDNQNG